VAKALAWAGLFMGGGLLLTTLAAVGLLAVIAAARGIPLAVAAGEFWVAMIAQTVAGVLSFAALTWLIGVRLLRLTARDLRWAPATAAPGGFARGLGLGIVTALVTFGLSAILGHTRLEADQGTIGDYLRRFSGILLLLIPAALFEEIMFRGVAQVVLARAVGRWGAILLISGLFALAHVRNPNTTPLGLLNIGLAGVFLGAAFYLPGGIWTAWGAHVAWNATLAGLEAPVSGLPLQLPLINYSAGGPAWLTGGAFGPEGGLTASLAIGAAIWFASRRTSTKESA
jgi:CAAX protease family protein